MKKKKPQSKKLSKQDEQKLHKLVPYISWSRLTTVETSEQNYVKTYIYGRKLKTKAMDFGTLVTEALEKKVKITDPVMQAVAELVPSYPKNNHKISTKLKIGKETVEVMGYQDGWNARKLIIGEYKTSLYPWSYDKAFQHGQMHLYAWIHWKNTGKIPKVELTWLETICEDGEYYLTGNFLVHRYQLTIKDMLNMEVRIKRGYEKIINVIEKELAI